MNDRRRVSGLLAALAVVIAILFLFHRYYGSDGLLYGDSNLQWDRSLLDAALAQLANAWAPAFGGGRPAIVINATTAAITLLQQSVSFFGIPLSTVLVYPLVLIVGYAGSWVAARRLSGSALSAHIVAAFFIGNPWIWDRVLLGHLLIVTAASIVAWIVATMVYRDRLGVAFAPVLFVGCAAMLLCDPRISYMLFVGFVVLAIHWLVRARRFRIRALALDGITLLLAPVAALALNGWWTIPFYTLRGINPVRRAFPPLDDVLSYSRYADFAHNIVFSGSFLHFSWDRALAHGLLAFVVWYAATVLIAPIALSGDTGSRTLNWILRAGILIALLASMGTALLPPATTMWIYAHVPMSAFFRDPNKLEFVALLCIVPLLAMRLARSPGLRPAVAILVLVAIAPIFSGDLRTTDGTGLQVFSERQNYVSVLHFIRSQPSFPDFRIAFLPPWTAEVSLNPGEHPVAEPFVFQYAVQTMDTKLINTASDMNMIAWRDFAHFYDGTDAHAAQSLGRLGIKYLVWDDAATMSAGGANTAFYNAPFALVKKAVDDAGFKEVYRVGSLHVLANPGFQPLLRTIAQPAVTGTVSESVRAQLPASAIGDTIQPLRGPASLPGLLSFGASRADACLSALPSGALTMAYDRVGAHSDWTANWVDSDYLQQGTGDATLARMLDAIPLPYAFTESTQAPLAFPVRIARGERIAVQGASLASISQAEYAIDGGGWQTLHLPSGMPGWVTLPPVSEGAHTLIIRGSKVGTVLRAVTTQRPTACPQQSMAMQPLPARPQGAQSWLMPAPTSSLTLTQSGGSFSFRARNAQLADANLSRALGASGRIPGPGSDGIMLDHLSTAIGVPFDVLTGYHHVEFFARGMPLAAGGWAHQLLDAPTGEPPQRTFGFTPRYSDEGASAEISRLTPGSTVLLRVPFTGGAGNAEVRVFQNGLLLTRFPLALEGSSYVTAPAYSDKISVVVHREGVQARSLHLLPLQAYAGVQLGDAILTLPSRAVRVRSAATLAAGNRTTAVQPLVFGGSDSRALISPSSIEAASVVRGASATLAYTGLQSSAKTVCTLSVNFETASGPVIRSVADVAVSPAGASGEIPIALEPRASALLPRFECRDASAVLSAGSVRLMFHDGTAGAMMVSLPRGPRAPATARVAHQTVSPEEYRIIGRPANLVSASSFDPAWQYGNNPHVVIDGAENGWLSANGDRVTYAIQAGYRRDAFIALMLWIGALAWIAIALMVEARRKKAREVVY